jgi:PIN domain nuclease of toxin-antitoxin system
MTEGLLLDTHVFLWWRQNSQQLSSATRKAIADAPIVFVSAASAWEVAIKSELGRVRLPEPFRAGVEDSGFVELAIGFEHAAAVENLPMHHSDPFDRMLVAQAQVERLVIVTHDRGLEPYKCRYIWT